MSLPVPLPPSATLPPPRRRRRRLLLHRFLAFPTCRLSRLLASLLLSFCPTCLSLGRCTRRRRRKTSAAASPRVSSITRRIALSIDTSRGNSVSASRFIHVHRTIVIVMDFRPVPQVPSVNET
ncbi:hypothetical protein PUN28_003515 [Cardiocondyla obscurior]|uniref:Uncharacterized protein n=1 Tax=Cardiocondyla obscurior TaxID=286306 RepID=A0AAW2GNZ7_9HYME